MKTYKANVKQTTNKVGNEIRKVWFIVQMIAKTTGAAAILFCAVKHLDNPNFQYIFAGIAGVLIFSVLWNIYCLLSND